MWGHMWDAKGLRDELHRRHDALRTRWVRGPWSLGAYEFLSFGIKQAWSCLFGGAMVFLLLATYLFYPESAPLYRADFLFLCALAIQIGMLITGLESWEEAKVIFAFHVVGTVMEIFKTHMGSWIYPDPAFFRIEGVPLFSGFMYACVGSYIARCWRIFDFRFDRFPPLWVQAVLAIAVYVNFFTHHFTVDIRLGLYAFSVLLYGPCVIWFRPDEKHRTMPMVVGLLLVALFIWFAENIGTLARAWTYPAQEQGWHMVSLQKLGAWYLLMIISFVLVAFVHRKNDMETKKLREP